jgi:hypothetical protein
VPAQVPGGEEGKRIAYLGSTARLPYKWARGCSTTHPLQPQPLHQPWAPGVRQGKPGWCKGENTGVQHSSPTPAPRPSNTAGMSQQQCSSGNASMSLLHRCLQ